MFIISKMPITMHISVIKRIIVMARVNAYYNYCHDAFYYAYNCSMHIIVMTHAGEYYFYYAAYYYAYYCYYAFYCYDAC